MPLSWGMFNLCNPKGRHRGVCLSAGPLWSGQVVEALLNRMVIMDALFKHDIKYLKNINDLIHFK